MTRTLALLLLLAAASRAEDPLRPLDWVIGTWSAEWTLPDGSRICDRFTWEPILGGKFLRGEYEAYQGGKPVRTEMTVIGWDPQLRTISGWTFSSDGGVRTSVVVDVSKPGRWVVETRGTGASGVEESRTTITREGEDALLSEREVRKEGRWFPAGSVKRSRQAAPSTPRAVVEAWFAAIAKRDCEGSLALGTAKFREQETSSKKAFTYAIFDRKLRFKGWEVTAETPEGAAVLVRVRAVLVDEAGEEDGEGMRFRLVQSEGRWKIDDLD
jgi:hypothetical protein